MLDLTYAQLMDGLDYECDIREPPDALRQHNFGIGWEDAALRSRVYRPTAMRRLTWQNLGNRLGVRYGPMSREEIDQIYTVLAEHYGKGSDAAS
jgi:hypothetical protein